MVHPALPVDFTTWSYVIWQRNESFSELETDAKLEKMKQLELWSLVT